MDEKDLMCRAKILLQRI